MARLALFVGVLSLFVSATNALAQTERPLAGSEIFFPGYGKVSPLSVCITPDGDKLQALPLYRSVCVAQHEDFSGSSYSPTTVCDRWENVRREVPRIHPVQECANGHWDNPFSTFRTYICTEYRTVQKEYAKGYRVETFDDADYRQERPWGPYFRAFPVCQN